MVSWRAAMALATESTRNGISSLTMPIRIRRLPASPPIDWISSVSSARRGAFGSDFGEEFRGLPLGLSTKPMGLAGQGISGQRLSNRLDQRRVQARVGRHEKIVLRE